MICPKCNKPAPMLFADGKCAQCQTFTAPAIPRKIKSTHRGKFAHMPLCIECKARKRQANFSRCEKCRTEFHRVCGIKSKTTKQEATP